MQSNNTTTRKGFLALMGGAIGAVAVGAKGAPQKAQGEADVASGSMPSELDRFFEVYHRLLSQLPNGGMRSQDIFWLHVSSEYKKRLEKCKGVQEGMSAWDTIKKCLVAVPGSAVTEEMRYFYDWKRDINTNLISVEPTRQEALLRVGYCTEQPIYENGKLKGFGDYRVYREELWPEGPRNTKA